jgi:hypothetical protein
VLHAKEEKHRADKINNAALLINPPARVERFGFSRLVACRARVGAELRKVLIKSVHKDVVAIRCNPHNAVNASISIVGLLFLSPFTTIPPSHNKTWNKPVIAPPNLIGD